MKQLILVSILSLSAFLPVYSEDNILMITFPNRTDIMNKVNPTSWCILQKINILPSIEQKTLSHLEVKKAVEKAFNNYNTPREISDLSNFWIKQTITDLIKSGTRTYPSKL